MTQREGGPMLTREALVEALIQWNKAWEAHDLDGVIELFHEDILFENWTGGQARGRENLRRLWTPWFTHHGNFRFTGEDTFIDVEQQKVLYRWRLDWPSAEQGYEGLPEQRRGVDLLHFKHGKIIEKLTY
ncbi:MAG: nuclear transport factor 2 family protein, partial [Desulfomonilia bacterium]|nr:nuclear transport factor 2 family protein [Desulfomonilia bacterium]